MINEVHEANEIKLAFVKSLNVQVFPCGRRRSTPIDTDGTLEGQFLIPFDPEARLNTEANNTKHSGVSGFKSSFIKSWNINKKELNLVLNGYNFKISLSNNYVDPQKFGLNTFKALGLSTDFLTRPEESANLYANIILKKTDLFSGFVDYDTLVLGDQDSGTSSETEYNLDLLISSKVNSTNSSEKKDPDNFYFSGLSFSAESLADLYSRNAGSVSVSEGAAKRVELSNGDIIVSLLLLKGEPFQDITLKWGYSWSIYQPALLPKIEHGNEEDSVKLEKVFVDDISREGISVPSVKLVYNAESDTYQLQFSAVDGLN